MGRMKSLYLDKLEADEAFRLALEADEDQRCEPVQPDQAELNVDIRSLSTSTPFSGEFPCF